MISDTVPRLIRLPDVERITGLRRSAIYQRIQRKEFPAPRKITARCSAWLEADVTAWIESRPVAVGDRVGSPAAA